MAQRYTFLGWSDSAMAAFGTNAFKLLDAGVTTGRVAYLRSIMVTETGGNAGILYIYDYNTEGASPTTTLQRATISFPASATTMVDFPAPGLKFVTGILGALAAAPGAVVGAYCVTVWGYEEG